MAGRVMSRHMILGTFDPQHGCVQWQVRLESCESLFCGAICFSGNPDTDTVMNSYARIMLSIISSSEALEVSCMDKLKSSQLISEIHKLTCNYFCAPCAINMCCR